MPDENENESLEKILGDGGETPPATPAPAAPPPAPEGDKTADSLAEIKTLLEKLDPDKQPIGVKVDDLFDAELAQKINANLGKATFTAEQAEALKASFAELKAGYKPSVNIEEAKLKFIEDAKVAFASQEERARTLKLADQGAKVIGNEFHKLLRDKGLLFNVTTIRALASIGQANPSSSLPSEQASGGAGDKPKSKSEKIADFMRDQEMVSARKNIFHPRYEEATQKWNEIIK